MVGRTAYNNALKQKRRGEDINLRWKGVSKGRGEGVQRGKYKGVDLGRNTEYRLC